MGKNVTENDLIKGSSNNNIIKIYIEYLNNKPRISEYNIKNLNKNFNLLFFDNHWMITETNEIDTNFNLKNEKIVNNNIIKNLIEEKDFFCYCLSFLDKNYSFIDLINQKSHCTNTNINNPYIISKVNVKDGQFFINSYNSYNNNSILDLMLPKQVII